MPFERPAQYGSRQFLTDEEDANRVQDVQLRVVAGPRPPRAAADGKPYETRFELRLPTT